MASLNAERVLVIGADGLIGSALSVSLKRTGKVIVETTRQKKTLSENRVFLDLNDDVSSWNLPDKITIAFFCAAINSLDYCYREPAKTTLVNVEHTVQLAQRLVKAGIPVVFFSTNLVYDGSASFQKDDVSFSPQTEHGRQKAEVEQQLLKLGDLVSVLRLAKIFGPDMPLLQQWISTLQNKEVIHPFSDKVVSPLPLAFVIKVSCRMANQRTSGTIQISGDRDITYAHLAYRLAEQLGSDRSLVQPIPARESGIFLEHLPRYTTLSTIRLVQELEIKTPSTDLTIDQVVKQNIATFKSKGRAEALK